jgi:pyruvate-formate lyase-activating enzyme
MWTIRPALPIIHRNKPPEPIGGAGPAAYFESLYSTIRQGGKPCVEQAAPAVRMFRGGARGASCEGLQPMAKNGNRKDTPFLLYADDRGRLFEHPFLRMAGYSGYEPFPLEEADLVPVPEFSKMFFLPGCPPVGVDPDTGRYEVLEEEYVGRRKGRCHAVAAFLEPGIVRTHLPASDCRYKDAVLPTWAYTAVGFRDGRRWAAGFRVEDNPRWDPRNYDDRDLVPAMESYRLRHEGPLVEHLAQCAASNHCFAAKNLFLRRWEAPLPVSRSCNAACLGCLSLQPHEGCEASHHRIAFVPSVEEIVSLAVDHLDAASPRAIVSFGQGCEGEPLTEYELIAESIRRIRQRTDRGTINLNTNGSMPGRVREIAGSGLDSIRISLNSARPDFYHAYYNPCGYGFGDVVESLRLSREMGLYTMVNYLVFPGVSDREAELEALGGVIRETGVQFLHLKNLCIDPQLYLGSMPSDSSPVLGMRRMASDLTENFPGLSIGYFNQAVRD